MAKRPKAPRSSAGEEESGSEEINGSLAIYGFLR